MNIISAFMEPSPGTTFVLLSQSPHLLQFFISSIKSYSNLKELPKIPDVVDIVVPPKITEKIVAECKKLKIKKIWMQSF